MWLLSNCRITTNPHLCWNQAAILPRVICSRASVVWVAVCNGSRRQGNHSRLIRLPGVKACYWERSPWTKCSFLFTVTSENNDHLFPLLAVRRQMSRNINGVIFISMTVYKTIKSLIIEYKGKVWLTGWACLPVAWICYVINTMQLFFVNFCVVLKFKMLACASSEQMGLTEKSQCRRCAPGFYCSETGLSAASGPCLAGHQSIK